MMVKKFILFKQLIMPAIYLPHNSLPTDSFFSVSCLCTMFHMCFDTVASAAHSRFHNLSGPNLVVH